MESLLRIRGRDPVDTYGRRLGALYYHADKQGLDEETKSRLAEKYLGAKPLDLDMSDSVWGETKRRITAGALQVAQIPLRFAQLTNSLGTPDIADIEGYEEKLNYIEDLRTKIPKKRTGFGYDVVEQLPTTAATVGVVAATGLLSGGYTIPALTSYGINMVFQSGDVFDRLKRDQRISDEVHSKYSDDSKSNINKRIRLLQLTAAREAGITAAILEAANPFNALEAGLYTKLGAAYRATKKAAEPGEQVIKTGFKEGAKRVGIGAGFAAGTEFGQEFTQNVTADWIVERQKALQEAGRYDGSKILRNIDYASNAYNAAVAAASAAPVGAISRGATEAREKILRNRIDQAYEHFSQFPEEGAEDLHNMVEGMRGPSQAYARTYISDKDIELNYAHSEVDVSATRAMLEEEQLRAIEGGSQGIQNFVAKHADDAQGTIGQRMVDGENDLGVSFRLNAARLFEENDDGTVTLAEDAKPSAKALDRLRRLGITNIDSFVTTPEVIPTEQESEVAQEVGEEIAVDETGEAQSTPEGNINPAWIRSRYADDSPHPHFKDLDEDDKAEIIDELNNTYKDEDLSKYESIAGYPDRENSLDIDPIVKRLADAKRAQKGVTSTEGETVDERELRTLKNENKELKTKKEIHRFHEENAKLREEEEARERGKKDVGRGTPGETGEATREETTKTGTPLVEASAEEEAEVITVYHPDGSPVEAEVTARSESGTIKIISPKTGEEVFVGVGKGGEAYSLSDPSSPDYVIKSQEDLPAVSSLSDKRLSELIKRHEEILEDHKKPSLGKKDTWNVLRDTNALKLEQKRRAETKTGKETPITRRIAEIERDLQVIYDQIDSGERLSPEGLDKFGKLTAEVAVLKGRGTEVEPKAKERKGKRTTAKKSPVKRQRKAPAPDLKAADAKASKGSPSKLREAVLKKSPDILESDMREVLARGYNENPEFDQQSKSVQSRIVNQLLKEPVRPTGGTAAYDETYGRDDDRVAGTELPPPESEDQTDVNVKRTKPRGRRKKTFDPDILARDVKVTPSKLREAILKFHPEITEVNMRRAIENGYGQHPTYNTYSTAKRNDIAKKIVGTPKRGDKGTQSIVFGKGKGKEEQAERRETVEEFKARTSEAELQDLPLTQDAQSFLSGVDAGGVPSTVTSNLKRIAWENGITVEKDTTPQDIINELRSKDVGPERVEEKETAGPEPAVDVEGDAGVEAGAGLPTGEGVAAEGPVETDTAETAKALESKTVRINQHTKQEINDRIDPFFKEKTQFKNLGTGGKAGSKSIAEFIRNKITPKDDSGKNRFTLLWSGKAKDKKRKPLRDAVTAVAELVEASGSRLVKSVRGGGLRYNDGVADLFVDQYNKFMASQKLPTDTKEEMEFALLKMARHFKQRENRGAAFITGERKAETFADTAALGVLTGGKKKVGKGVLRDDGTVEFDVEGSEYEYTEGQEAELQRNEAKNVEIAGAATEEDFSANNPNKILARETTGGSILSLSFSDIEGSGTIREPFTPEELNQLTELGWGNMNDVFNSYEVVDEESRWAEIPDRIRWVLLNRMGQTAERGADKESRMRVNRIMDRFNGILRQQGTNYKTLANEKLSTPSKVRDYMEGPASDVSPFMHRTQAQGWVSVFPILTRKTGNDKTEWTSTLKQRGRELESLEGMGVTQPWDLADVQFVKEGAPHGYLAAIVKEEVDLGNGEKKRTYKKQLISRDLHDRLSVIAKQNKIAIGSDLMLPEGQFDVKYEDPLGVFSDPEADIKDITEFHWYQPDSDKINEEIASELVDEKRLFNKNGEMGSKYGKAIIAANGDQTYRLERLTEEGAPSTNYLEQVPQDLQNEADNIYKKEIAGKRTVEAIEDLKHRYQDHRRVPGIPYQKIGDLAQQGYISNVIITKATDGSGDYIAHIYSDDTDNILYQLRIDDKGTTLSESELEKAHKRSVKELQLLKERRMLAEEEILSVPTEEQKRERILALSENEMESIEEMTDAVEEAQLEERQRYEDWVNYAKENDIPLDSYRRSSSRAQGLAEDFKYAVEKISHDLNHLMPETIQQKRLDYERQVMFHGGVGVAAQAVDKVQHNDLWTAEELGSAFNTNVKLQEKIYDQNKEVELGSAEDKTDAEGVRGSLNFSSMAPKSDIGRGLPREETQAVVDGLISKYKGSSQLSYIVLNKPSQVKGKNLSPRARGHIVGKTIYLFSDNIKDGKTARKVWMHETIGHAGIESMLGPEEFNALLDDIIKSRPRDIQQIKDDYSGKVDLEQDGIPLSNRDAAREIIARVAEGSINKPGLLRKLINKIRESIRRVFGGLQVSDNEIKSYLFDAEGLFQSGELAINEVREAYSLNLPDAANKAIDIGRSLARSVSSAFDPFANLDEHEKMLDKRSLSQGELIAADRVARALKDTLTEIPQPSQLPTFEYLLTQSKPQETAGTLTDSTAAMIPDPASRPKAIKTKQMFIELGQALVDRGILDGETYEVNKGKYVPVVFLKHLLRESDFQGLISGNKGMDISYLKQQKIDDPFIQALLGRIKDPAYVASRGWLIPTRDIIMYDRLEEMSNNPNWAAKDTMVNIEPYVPANFAGAKVVSAAWALEEGQRILKHLDEGYITEKKAAIEKMARGMIAEAEDKAPNIKEKLESKTERWRQVPNEKRYGRLAGMLVREEVYSDTVGAIQIIQGDITGGMAQRIIGDNGYLTRANKFWKFSKVALNPPTQIRNGVTNGIMLHLSGVPFVEVPQYVIKALRDVHKNGKYSQIADKYGIGKTTYASEELTNFDTEIEELMQRTQGHVGVNGVMNVASKHLKTFMGHAGNVYGGVEKVFKVASIMHSLEKGLKESVLPYSKRRKLDIDNPKDVAEAVRYANKYLLDYSLVSPSVRYLRNSPLGTPFITYYLKIMPALKHAALNNPTAFAPYIASSYAMAELFKHTFDMEDDDFDKVRKAMPKWIRDKGHVYLLPYKKGDGSVAVLDLSTMVPWGAHYEVVKHIKDGKIGDAAQTFGLFAAPLWSIGTSVMTGIDPFTKRPIDEEWYTPMEKLTARLGYAYQLGAPSFVTQNGWMGKMWDAYKRVPDRYGDQKTSYGQAWLRLAGINIYNIHPRKTRATEGKRRTYITNQLKGRFGKEYSHAIQNGMDKEDLQALKDSYMERIRERNEETKEYIKASKFNKKILE